MSGITVDFVGMIYENSDPSNFSWPGCEAWYVGVLTRMSGLSIDRSSRGMNVEVKEMDVIVAEFVHGKL
jgi:hypothetical protein